VSGDFNGDGYLDLAADTGQILLGNGHGTFELVQKTFQPANTGGVATGDFNGDGKLHLAAAASGGIVILLGSGHATF